MPITGSSDTGYTITGNAIDWFQARARLSALKLEALGMKRRGPSVLSIIRQEHGIKARTAKDAIPEYEAWIAKTYPNGAPQD